MAWALELPRADPRAGDAVRLVTRDDTGEPDHLIVSLEEIARRGAAIIVTGLDGPTADRAIEWAESKQIALIALAPPTSAKTGGFTFLLGEALEPVVTALAASLAASAHGRAAVIAPVVEGDAARAFERGLRLDGTFRAPVSCDLRAARAGEPRFPVASWAAAGVHAWLLATSPECASDVVHEVGARAQGGVFALTLDAAGLTARPAQGSRVLAAAAGIVPAGAGTADDPRELEARKMAVQLGGQPTWWAALGRDAGALARKALSTLPEDTVTLPAEIAKRHRDARDALAAARVGLWTTDAQGFVEPGNPRCLGRALRVIRASVSARPTSIPWPPGRRYRLGDRRLRDAEPYPSHHHGGDRP